MEQPLFSVGRSAPTPASSSTPLPAQPAQGGTDLAQRHRELRQQHEKLKENRVRRTLMLQQAMEEDERCRQAAAAFGASSPEELERILDEAQKKAQEELDAFEKALAEEAALQERIEQDLAAAENR